MLSKLAKEKENLVNVFHIIRNVREAYLRDRLAAAFIGTVTIVSHGHFTDVHSQKKFCSLSD